MTERQPPRIDDAPGLVLVPRKRGLWSVVWRSQEPGFEPKNRFLCAIDDSPTDEEREYIAGWCQILQAEMHEWKRGPGVRAFDGTLKSLIEHYQSDKDST